MDTVAKKRGAADDHPSRDRLRSIDAARKNPATGAWCCGRCGFEWRSEAVVQVGWQLSREGHHVCPRCGAGFWTYPIDHRESRVA